MDLHRVASASERVSDFQVVQAKMRTCGLRWLHRHGHLDSAAIHTMDTPDHPGG
jgi:hypothetical protein